MTDLTQGIDKTLNEREGHYGAFIGQATLSQLLKDEMYQADRMYIHRLSFACCA